jgi:hypothetical protein
MARPAGGDAPEDQVRSGWEAREAQLVEPERDVVQGPGSQGRELSADFVEAGCRMAREEGFKFVVLIGYVSVIHKQLY